MSAQGAQVINLAEYRAKKTSVQTPAKTALVWFPVWLWVPVWSVRF